MVAVTIGADRLAAADAGNKFAERPKGLFARVYDAITYSQMMRAEREIARYRYLLPPDFKLHRNLWSGHEEKLPLGGW